MIVCVCRRVSDHQIREAAAEGAVSLECLKTELGVATQCGQCESCARDVVAQCSASHPVAALNRESQPSSIQLASAITESRTWNSSRPSASA